MAGLSWAALVLVVFLSAGGTWAAVDHNWLTSVIEGIKNEYALGDAFSVAVNVPQNQDINNLQQVFQDDPADKVKQTVSEGQVYQGARVVAAAQPEALSRILENIQPLITSSQGHFLVIYSEESPCGPTCTANANEDSKINDAIQNWSGYAFAFSKVHDVPAADSSQIAESFKQLQISQLGLDNIFHCYKPGDDPFQCTSCSSGGDVTPSCVANDVPSNQEEGADEEVSTVPPAGTDTGSEIAPGEETGAEITAGIGGGTGGGGGKATGGPESKCKGRGRGCKRRGGGKRRGVGRRGKGGKVRKQCKRKGGCKRSRRRAGGRGGGSRRRGLQ